MSFGEILLLIFAVPFLVVFGVFAAYVAFFVAALTLCGAVLIVAALILWGIELWEKGSKLVSGWLKSGRER